ncbi:MAG: hypothetical protein WC554_15925 [Clostridia bacterium]
MLNDNLLGNKLNSFKNKQASPEIKEPIKLPTHITQTISGFVFIIKFVIFLLRSFALGFALKTVFATNWSFWGFFFVGFSTNYIINSIAIFFNKEL